MKHNYTYNFLIKYLYKEDSALRRLEIENALNSDSELKRHYKGLLKAIKMLPGVMFYPKDSTVNSILKYSAA